MRLIRLFLLFIIMISVVVFTRPINGQSQIINSSSSGDEATVFSANKAVDGNFSTRWASTVGIGEKFLEFEYAQAKNLYGLRILWERRNVNKYKIEIAQEPDLVFKEIYRSNSNSGQIDEIVNFDQPYLAKKVRITILDFSAEAPDINLKSVSWATVSIFEVVGIFSETDRAKSASDNVNIALNKSVSFVDSNLAMNDNMLKITDGNLDDGFVLPSNSSTFFKIDLGELYSLRSFSLYWDKANPYDYELYSSVDGEIWVKQYIYRPGNSSNWRQNEVFNWDTDTHARYMAIKFNPNNVAKDMVPVLKEVMVYSNEQQVPNSSLNNIKTLQLNSDGTKLLLPTMETGEIRILNSSDLPIISLDGTVNKPLVDKEVKVFLGHFGTDGNLISKKEIKLLISGIYGTLPSDSYKLPVVPTVQQYYTNGGFTKLDKTIHVSTSVSDFGSVLKEFCLDANNLHSDYTFRVDSVLDGSNDKINNIVFVKNNTINLGNEGYVIKIENNKITVEVESAVGAYYATRTLLQLDINKLPVSIIKDYPLYPVRGFMIDVGRKFIPIKYLKEIINNMSFYKLNDLQLHLNDNNIWLHEVSNDINEILNRSEAGFRIETGIVGDNGKKLTSDQHYTKQEFIDLVNYAKLRGVNIIPEIDSPGHALALTKVRPDLYYKGQLEAGKNNVERAAMLDLSNPNSLIFVKQIFDELIGDEANPGPFYNLDIIHIGADEYYGDSNSYLKFLNEMMSYIRSKGKIVRFWGSLSRKVGSVEIDVENIKNSQLHLWSEYYNSYGRAKELGFKVINITDNPTYSVPDGTYSVGAGYRDFISLEALFNARPYRFSGRDAYSVSDPDVLGNGYAIWNDHNCDVVDKGLTSHDIFLRFIQPLPYSALRGWIDDNNIRFADFKALVDKIVVPRSNPYFLATAREESEFNKNLNNWQNNPQNDLKTNLDVLSVDHSLYLEVEFNKLNNQQKMMFNDDSTVWWRDSEGYFAYDFEGRHIQFDFKPEINQKYKISIKNREQNLVLEVNGVKINKIKNSNKPKLVHTTLLLPVANIAAIDGKIYNLSLTSDRISNEMFVKNSEIVNVSASSSETRNENNHISKAFDDNNATIWHTAWDNKSEAINKLPFSVEVSFDNPKNLKGFYYLSRSGGDNGKILKYRLYVMDSNSSEFKIWNDNGLIDIKDKKHIWKGSEPMNDVSKVKIEILDGFNGYASAAEFKFILADKEIDSEPVLELDISKLEEKIKFFTDSIISSYQVDENNQKLIELKQTLEEARKFVASKPLNTPENEKSNNDLIKKLDELNNSLTPIETKNESNSVIVKYSSAVFNNKVQLIANKEKADSNQIIYNVKFVDEDRNEVNVKNGWIKLSLPVSDNWTDKSKIELIHIHGDNREKINSFELVNSKVEFSVNHLSSFEINYISKDDTNGNSNTGSTGSSGSSSSTDSSSSNSSTIIYDNKEIIKPISKVIVSDLDNLSIEDKAKIEAVFKAANPNVNITISFIGDQIVVNNQVFNLKDIASVSKKVLPNTGVENYNNEFVILFLMIGGYFMVRRYINE